MASLSRSQEKLVESLVQQFESKLAEFRLFADQVRGRISETKPLFSLIHSLKWRVKEPSHLGDKLRQKIEAANQEKRVFKITEENLFSKINDLAGIRLLHLHTRQMEDIHHHLSEALNEGLFPIMEGPVAKTWDNETRDYFRDIGIQTEDSDSLYTSVHYVIGSNSKTKYTCEIQVRTLAEELWGEVSHSFNYPRPTQSVACREQIKVLARMTSGCSRLVDSVFLSLREFESKTGPTSMEKKAKRQ